MSGSGISWAICNSAPRSRQITMLAPTTQFFTGRMPFLPPNQQRQSTEGCYIKMSQIYKHSALGRIGVNKAILAANIFFPSSQQYVCRVVITHTVCDKCTTAYLWCITCKFHSFISSFSPSLTSVNSSINCKQAT